MVFSADEPPRATSLELLARLKPVVTPDGTVTEGNASGLNDGAAALLVAPPITGVGQDIALRVKRT